MAKVLTSIEAISPKPYRLGINPSFAGLKPSGFH